MWKKPQYYEVRIYATNQKSNTSGSTTIGRTQQFPHTTAWASSRSGSSPELQDSRDQPHLCAHPVRLAGRLRRHPARLAADADYQQAAAEFLNAPKSNPAYVRFESSLLVAFDGMKRMSLPPADQKPNVFELRTYLSSSEGKA